jgi:hypothetical protein
MEMNVPPSPRAAAIWYLWSSSFAVSIVYAPRWPDDAAPYAVQFPKNYDTGDFVRLDEREAQWLIDQKVKVQHD